MRTLLISLSLFFVIATSAFAQQTNKQKSFDEWSDSPTITLDCGTFPAVRVIIDGREAESRGIIRNGRVYLPARESLEQLGGRVLWVKSQRAFYSRFPARERTIKVTVNSPVVRIYRYAPSSWNGVGAYISSVRLNTSPFLCEGRVFAPVRTAADAVGATSSYDAKNRTLRITSPGSAKT